MFVYDHRSRTEIAMALDCDVFELGRISRERDWENKRAAAIEIQRRIAEQDPLKTHEILSMRMLRQIEVLLTQLENDNDEAINPRVLRGKIESLRSLAEASNNTIKIHREARGLRPGTPSSATAEDADGVAYVVRVRTEPAASGVVS